MKGYKVFNEDWTCRGMKYEVGKTYKEDVEPKLCSRGLHFCEKVADCFNYYSFDPRNKIAEVQAIGKTVSGNDKSVTNELVVVREISWEEMLTLANTGKGNTGISNSGDCNSGDSNSGDRNSGDRNSGDCNSGDSNSGDWNSGDWNSGDSNSGDCNSGDWNSGDSNSGDSNSGDCNSGDWNLSDGNSGCFNTEEHTIKMFDQETEITLYQWRRSEAYSLLCGINYEPTTWVSESRMTDKEKEENQEYKTTGGYLRQNDLSKVNQEWWNELSAKEKIVIKEIPNFDAGKFKQITGMDVEDNNVGNM